MGLLSSLIDLYENTRKTKSTIKATKPKERKYDFDAGFTGDRKIDCPTYKPTKNKEQKNKSKDEFNER